MLNIINHYLRNRNVYIEVSENRSENFKSEVSLLQGSILTPIKLLFYPAELFQEKVKLESTAMTPHMFQQATPWKKFFQNGITKWIGK